MEIFFTSDTHFCHDKPFLYEPRGFSCVEDMNKAIVDRWNSVIGPETIVYHLGDMCLTDTEAAIPYINRLNGKITWLRGNHCSDKRVDKILAACPNVKLISKNKDNAWAYVLKDGKWRFYLSHYPTKVANYDDEGSHKTWCLCGHTHTQDKWLDIKDSCYHVEMDAHNCMPVSLEQIKEDIRTMRDKDKMLNTYGMPDGAPGGRFK